MSELVVARKLWESEDLKIGTLPKKLTPEKRKEIIRTTAKQARIMGDQLSLVQGELLYEISKNSYWKDWNYQTFEEYIENELEFKRRKAFYLMQIYEKFVVELGLPIDILKTLEWSKAKELAPIVTKDNWKQIMDEVSGKSVREIRTYVRGKIGKVSADTFQRLTFHLTDEQKHNVELAIQTAGALTGSDKQGHLMDTIATDFLASHAGEDGIDSVLNNIDVQIKNFERTYGVVLEIKEVKKGVNPKFDNA